MVFEQIFGHKQQIQILQTDLENSHLAHAYLFSGPSQIGKFQVALAFAKALQTDGLNAEEIRIITKQIDQGTHLDTLIFRNNGESLKIEPIRQAILELHLSGNSHFRILVIEDIERMTLDCSNALLKILEEPPRGVIFLFTTSKVDAVLETILSRLRIISFSLFRDEDMTTYLQQQFPSLKNSELERLIKLSLGQIGLAIKLVYDENLFKNYENIYGQIEQFLTEKDLIAAFAFIESIHQDKMLVELFIQIASMIFRKQMHEDVQRGANYDILKRKLEHLENLFQVKALSQRNVNSRLLLENLILSL